MNLKQIEEILSLLDSNNYERIKEVLIKEKEKFMLLSERQNLILVQKAFENYISEIAVYNRTKWSNLYSFMDGLFTFTNGISIYQLKKELVIPKEIKEKQRKESNEVYLLRKATEKELYSSFEQCNKLLGENRLLVDFFSKSVENQVVNYESGIVSHLFNLKQIEYMDKFLGQNAKTYISDKNPIVYAESDKGKGYVLGIKRK